MGCPSRLLPAEAGVYLDGYSQEFSLLRPAGVFCGAGGSSRALGLLPCGDQIMRRATKGSKVVRHGVRCRYSTRHLPRYRRRGDGPSSVSSPVEPSTRRFALALALVYQNNS